MQLRQLLAALLAIVVVVGFVPGVVAAQAGGSEQSGGLVEVAAGETFTGDLEAVGGTIRIAGTVTGDVDATGGSILVTETGVVEGSLQAVGGSIIIEGAVNGDVEVTGGSVLVRDGATVGGTLEAAAGSITVDGDVAGGARLAAESVVVGPTATVGGDLLYDAESFSIAPEAAVAGTVRVDENPVEFDSEFVPPFLPGDLGVIPQVVGVAFGLLANLALGVVLLLAVPRFSSAVTTLGTAEAIRSGGFGLLAFVGIPIVLVLVALTIVGIPLSLAGFVAFALLLWVAFVYGALVLGTWLLSLAERDQRWLALLVGVVVVSLVSLVPFAGPIVSFLVLLVGLGAFVLAVRGVRGDEEGGVVVTPPDDESPAA